jgi:uncharacterized protein (TIGR02391 family)
MGLLLKQVLPNADDLLTLAPEQLGKVMLTLMKKHPPQRPEGIWLGQNHFYCSIMISDGNPPYGHQKEAVYLAVMEGLAWLERTGLIAWYIPYQGGEAFFVTARAWELETPADLDSYLRADQLPRALLHPDVLQAALPDFLEGDYDTAVLKAFREIEVRLRDFTGCADPNVKINDLVQSSFRKGGLPRIPQDVEEQKDLRMLINEAMKWFRNPTVHNSVTMPLEEAVEAIALASYLRRLVD